MLTVSRQCELMDLSRSSLYYQPADEDHYNLLLMRLLDEQFARTMQRAADRIDASYLLMAHASAIGHFWLASVESAVDARRPELRIPELGIGIADAYHGRGLAKPLLAAAYTSHALSRKPCQTLVPTFNSVNTRASPVVIRRHGFVPSYEDTVVVSARRQS